MIYEYAVEPDLIIDWAVAGAGVYVQHFGMDRRRLVSDFPKDWKGHVYGALYKRFDDDDTSLEFQNVQPIVDAYLQEVGDHMVPRSTSSNLDGEWFDAALLEHGRWPFKAIVARSDHEAECREIVTPAVMNDIRDKRWRLETVKPTTKSGADIAAALGPLLHMSHRVVLVDPYFQAELPRFTETFTAIVNEARRRPRNEAQQLQLTVISGVDWARKGREELTTDERKRIAGLMHHRAQERLPHCIPRGAAVEFLCLASVPDAGNPLHNRYVLTDVAGVILPYGTAAQAENGNPAPTDDLLPMPSGIYAARWSQYASGTKDVAVLAPQLILGCA